MPPAPREKTPLIFLGSGPYSYTMADMFMSRPDWPYRLAGFAQNLDGSKRGDTYEGLPVHTLEELRPLARTHEAICVLGDGSAKQRFTEQVAGMGFRFATLIHPGTYLSPRSSIGEGGLTAISTNISAHVTIGRHCTLCNHANVSEAVRIGDCVYVGPGVQIAGSVTIGSRVFIGIQATISDHLTIGDGATIGAGAVVIRDVPADTTVVGNPARPIERRRDESPEA